MDDATAVPTRIAVALHPSPSLLLECTSPTRGIWHIVVQLQADTAARWRASDAAAAVRTLGGVFGGVSDGQVCRRSRIGQ